MSGFINQSWLSGLQTASGGFYASGIGVIINSGVGVTVQSGVILVSGLQIAVPLSGVIINNSGNPLQMSSGLSGGYILWSGAVNTITVKAPINNVGPIYVGGHIAGQMPYSGVGYIMAAGDIVCLNIPNIGYIRVVNALSGDRVTWIGT